MSSLEQLQRALAGQEEKPAKGLFTAEHWAQEWGKTLKRARELLYEFTAAKLMERKYYRRWTGKRMLPIPHYGLIKGPARSRPLKSK